MGEAGPVMSLDYPRTSSEAGFRPDSGIHTRAAAVVVLVWLVAVAAVAVSGDPIGIGLTLALPLMPIAAHLLLKIVDLAPLRRMSYGVVLGVGTILLVSVSFRIREYADKSIDAQVLMKLVGVVLLLALGVPVLLRRIGSGIAPAPLLWLCFLAFLLVSATYAEAPVHAIFGAASLIGGFLFAWNYAEIYGRDGLVRLMLISSAVLCIASLVVYVAAPELGRLKDWENGVLVSTWRLQGVLGAPNGVGGSAGFSLLAATLLLKWQKKGLGFWAVMALFALCVLLSNNRMALVGIAACFLVVFLSRGDWRFRSIPLLLIVVVAGVQALAFSDELLAGLSRSGSPEELLTATGRTNIWTASIALWLEHPLLGLGFNSSLQILPARTDLFTAAAHTHNVFLEILFSGGLIGLGLFLAAMGATLRKAVACGRYANLGILLFFMLHGLTEPVVFGTINFYPLAFFSAAILAFAEEPQRR
jgi:O-antigen ligase